MSERMRKRIDREDEEARGTREKKGDVEKLDLKEHE